VWSVVRVPTCEEGDRRQLHRELRTLKKERTPAVNRMQGLLASQGVRLSKGRDVPALLEAIRLWDGSPTAIKMGRLPPGLSTSLPKRIWMRCLVRCGQHG
jgi:transposase